MTITFLSNYINHHQIPFCDACYEQMGEDFCFVQAMPMEQERIDMGWNKEDAKRSYVRLFYEEEDICKELIEDCDILLAGWSDKEDLVQKRLLAGKPVVRISERIYREGQWKMISPKGLISKYREHFRFRNKKAYLLCAGAYVASDFSLIKSYPDKMYQWGYFPETVTYTTQQWESLKAKEGTLDIVWAGRFIPLKHPEYMLRLAAELKEREDLWANQRFCDFHIHMVGSGELEVKLKSMAKELDVGEKVTFYGFMGPKQVREIMEKSHVHVFTSNHLEGWGAVVNEAMNSGCVEVASSQAGAVPYLVSHGENGLVYENDSFEKMAESVCYLIANQEKIRYMSKNAYDTITKLWNAENAAKELFRFCKEIKEGIPSPAKEGPFSRAPVVSPRKMYQYMLKQK